MHGQRSRAPWMCFPCGCSDSAWRSFTRTLRLWSRCCRGTAKAAIQQFAKGSISGGRDGSCLSSAFIWQIQCLVSGLGSTHCGFFRPIKAQTLQLSDSEELDVASANAIYTEDSPPQSHAYEELVEVLTRAVERLNIDWPAEREGVRSKSRLDEHVLPSRTQPQPQRQGLPFFPRCGDHGRNQFLIEFIVHKHHTIPLY